MSEKISFSRHTERSDGSMGYLSGEQLDVSEKYPSITKEGETKAREIANDNFKTMVESSPESSILFIGGSSEEDRTKATAEIIGDELAIQYEGDEDVIVYTKEDIDNLQQTLAKDESIFTKLRELINSNSGKKLVFTFPLYLKEFSLRPHHRDRESGEHTEYLKELLEKTGLDEPAAVIEWFKNNGQIQSKDGRILSVPSPKETAETHIQGINRLREFAQKFAKDRPINIGLVGHGWQLDALAVYLANKGKVDAKAFQELFGSEVIKQPEAGQISIEDDKINFDYRGKDYEVSKELLKK